MQLTLLEEDSVTFNEKQLEMDQQFDGYYGIQYSDPSSSYDQVLNVYQGLWKIEDSFHLLKSNFEARPIYVWTEESIQGHFVLCYLALVLQRLLEYGLHKKGLTYSTEKIQAAIRSSTLTQLNAEGRTLFTKNKSDEIFSELLQVFGVIDLPTYGEQDKRKHAIYIPKNKEILKKAIVSPLLRVFLYLQLSKSGKN